MACAGHVFGIREYMRRRQEADQSELGAEAVFNFAVIGSAGDPLSAGLVTKLREQTCLVLEKAPSGRISEHLAFHQLVLFIAKRYFEGPHAMENQMTNYIMIVQSRPKDGRDNDYNEWYDGIHLSDICAIPGVKSGRRFTASGVHLGKPGLPYLGVFEIETDDPSQIMKEMAIRATNGTMQVSDALDAAATVLWFYRAHQLPQS
jgi:hypothetical protein